MINQKQISKQYKYLHSQKVSVYIGRIKTNFKTILHELSLDKKSNEYGEYKEIEITICKTNFNGKVLTITHDLDIRCNVFKIELDDIPTLLSKLNHKDEKVCQENERKILTDFCEWLDSPNNKLFYESDAEQIEDYLKNK